MSIAPTDRELKRVKKEMGTKKSFYLEQLKKVSPLYPLGAQDPKKKLSIMQQYSRQAEHRGKADRIAEIKQAVKAKKS